MTLRDIYHLPPRVKTEVSTKSCWFQVGHSPETNVGTLRR